MGSLLVIAAALLCAAVAQRPSRAGVKTMQLFRSLLVFTASGFACLAGSVTYTESVNTGGIIDGHTFTSVPVTLTLTGDTNNIISMGNGQYRLLGTININVNNGQYTDSLLHQGEVDVNQGGTPAPYGGMFADSAIVLFTTNSNFSTYALATSAGPWTGASIGYTGGSYQTTSGGSFYLAGPFNVDHPSTFQAAVQASVPEPGTLLLAFGGMAVLWTRRRFSAK